MATKRQLIAAGLSNGVDPPERPWHPIRGDVDASTLWYEVLRKQERGIWLGTVAFRRSDHHLLLLRHGWEEISIEEIAAFGPEAGAEPAAEGGGAQVSRSPFDG